MLREWARDTEGFAAALPGIWDQFGTDSRSPSQCSLQCSSEATPVVLLWPLLPAPESARTMPPKRAWGSGPLQKISRANSTTSDGGVSVIPTGMFEDALEALDEDGAVHVSGDAANGSFAIGSQSFMKSTANAFKNAFQSWAPMVHRSPSMAAVRARATPKRVTVANKQDLSVARRRYRKGAFEFFKTAVVDRQVDNAIRRLPGGTILIKRRERRRSAIAVAQLKEQGLVPPSFLEAGIPALGEDEDGITLSQCVFNTLSSTWGEGLLVLPYTLRIVGWMAVPLIVIMGAIGHFCNHLLVLAEDPIADLSLAHICYRAWGKPGFAISAILFYILCIAVRRMCVCVCVWAGGAGAGAGGGVCGVDN